MTQLQMLLVTQLTLIVICGPSPVLGFIRFNIPPLERTDWASYNSEVKDLLGPLHHELSQSAISPKQAAIGFAQILQNFFSSKPEFTEETTSESYIDHEPSSLSQTRKKKNALRKKAFSQHATEDDRKAFQNAIKAISFLKNQHRAKQKRKSTAHLEKMYRNDFWKFSKKCAITLWTVPQHIPHLPSKLRTNTTRPNTPPPSNLTSPASTGFLTFRYRNRTLTCHQSGQGT